jgi:hypothetical protein
MIPVRWQNTLATVRSESGNRELKPKPHNNKNHYNDSAIQIYPYLGKLAKNAKLIIIRKSLMWLCLQKGFTTNKFHKYTAPLYCSSERFLWLPRKCAVIIKYPLVRTQASFRGQMTSETGTVIDFLHEDVRWICPQKRRLTPIITPSGS